MATDTVEKKMEVKKCFKVWNYQKTTGKLIACEMFESFMQSVRKKFMVDDISRVRIVDAERCEVDDDSLILLPDYSSLYVLIDHEELTLETEVITTCKTQTLTTGTVPIQSASATPGLESVMKLVESIRQKKKNTTGGPKKHNVSLGWMNYSYKDNRYKQIRSSKGEKTITENILLCSTTNYEELLAKAISVFFPKGRSRRGRREKMVFALGNSKGVEIPKEGFTVEQHLKKLSTQKARFYLLSKPTSVTVEDIWSSSSSDDLPELQTPRKRQRPVDSGPTGAGPTPTMDIDIGNQSFLDLFESNDSTMVGLDVVNIDVQNEETTCHICTDKKKDSVLIPCGHTFCYPCCLHFYVNKEPCPMCRKGIEKVVNPSNM